MTFQLQPPAQIWDEEITTGKWRLPAPKQWTAVRMDGRVWNDAVDGRLRSEQSDFVPPMDDFRITAPKSSIEQMCDAAMLEIAAWVELSADWHANCITLAFEQARARFGVPYVESFSMANPDGSLMKVTMEWQ